MRKPKKTKAIQSNQDFFLEVADNVHVLYQSFIRAGFSSEQAFELTKVAVSFPVSPTAPTS